MTSKAAKIFITDVHVIPSKRIYVTNKLDVFYLDNTLSRDLLDLNEYGTKNNESYSYILVAIVNFCKMDGHFQ